MKAFVVMAASLTLCASLTSCDDRQQEAQPTLGAVATAGQAADRPKFDGNDCVGSGGDCTDPTPPIHPPTATGGRSSVDNSSAIASFDNIMSEPAMVGKYFIGNEWKNTFSQLAEKNHTDVLQALRSGTCYFIKYRSPESGKLFYIGGRKDVGLANHDFVIPVTE